ncbi:hypothetical protein ASPBRDRAFT_197056 [Aspergillus brasiliensis CBS 101740]|uniref:TLDc domain-containing protein n=1 Tax=Aspergillus brasiliensis (strain CBS 101740 / IMI 381727 / IBT 21946) TaxID=767769 RepID=A0A1L9UFC6_ASPBC|nr:hypothetical protein ASPBRDRAFT_197056 [Aspergillus brasiliensis CBS 101740]
MGAILGNTIDQFVSRSQRKRVESYLQVATADSVLEDLSNTTIIRDLPATISPQAIFDASCIRDGPGENPYWTKESLKNHLAKAHPGTPFPDKAIDVLWSSFYFHAYHPFPRVDVEHGKLEFPAFQRALGLLALQGAGRLGSVENGFGTHWRPDRSHTHRLHQTRILRSISCINGSKSVASDQCMLDDVVDVLFTTHPFSMKYPTDPALVKPVAERLLGGGVPNYQLSAEGLQTLISLVVRMRHCDLTWGGGIHCGFFEEASPLTEDLSRTLVQSLQNVQADILHPDAVLRASRILSNIESRFHELWATIFQPQMPKSSPILGPALEDPLSSILRTVSLFIPAWDGDEEPEQGKAFQSLYDSSNCESSHDLDLTHLFGHNTQDEPILVLFLGNQVCSPAPVVVGTFSTGIHNDGPVNQKGSSSSKLATPEIIFLLQPSLSILQWEGPKITPASSTRLDSTESYWIGHPSGSNIGMRIDPTTKQATVYQSAAPAADLSLGGYKQMISGHDGVRPDDGHTSDQVMSFIINRIAVYGVTAV